MKEEIFSMRGGGNCEGKDSRQKSNHERPAPVYSTFERESSELSFSETGEVRSLGTEKSSSTTSTKFDRTNRSFEAKKKFLKETDLKEEAHSHVGFGKGRVIEKEEPSFKRKKKGRRIQSSARDVSEGGGAANAKIERKHCATASRASTRERTSKMGIGRRIKVYPPLVQARQGTAMCKKS